MIKPGFTTGSIQIETPRLRPRLTVRREQSTIRLIPKNGLRPLVIRVRS
jgi:hypothetical protein